VINTPLSIMRDDPPPLPDSPSVPDDTPTMFQLSSDDDGSNEDLVEDNRTPLEKEHDQQRRSEAFQHGRPGFIPNTIGVCIPLAGGNIKERDNSFWGMLSNHYYWSHQTNTVYPGRHARAAYEMERQPGRLYAWPKSSKIRTRAPRGFPMSPKEVDDLITVVNNLNHPAEDRVHTYSLLSELQYITNRIVPSGWDRTMSYLVQEEIVSQISRPVPDDHWAWRSDLVPAPEEALHYVPDHLTAGSGVNTSDATLDLRQVLWQLPHHNRPGGRNPILGVIFNYTFQVELHSVFGYMLGRVLSPNYSNG